MAKKQVVIVKQQTSRLTWFGVMLLVALAIVIMMTSAQDSAEKQRIRDLSRPIEKAR